MKLFTSLLLAGAVGIGGLNASAQSTYSINAVGFLNVQGVLHENGVPVNGFMWFCFDLYYAPTGGTSLAHDTNMNYVLISNGIANVTYRIGDLTALSLSPTQELYLQMDVSRTGEPGSFTVLNPRQRIVPAMFATSAVRAEEARRLIEPLSVDLLPPSVPRLDGSPIFQGTVTTRSNLNAARLEVGTGHLLTGVGASIAGGAANTNRAEAAAIGGGGANTIAASARYAAIAGGFLNTIDSLFCFIGGGMGNSIGFFSDYSTIGGGDNNDIADHSDQSTVGGGTDNDIADLAPDSTIGGGQGNDIRNSAGGSTIGGGVSNTVDQAAVYATVSGGYSNVVGRGAGAIGGGEHNFVAAFSATVAGGFANQVLLEAKGSAIGGGASNVVESAVTNGTIAGGLANIIHTNSNFSTIGGGRENHIGSSAPFATIPGGREAKAFNYGQVAYASGGFAGQEGTAQGSFYVVHGITTDTNSADLFLDGSSERIHVPAGSTWTYDILVTARTATPGSAGFQIRGMIGYNSAGNLILLGPPVIDQFFGGAAITAQVVADNVNKALTVKVRWNLVNPDPVRWVATVRTAEVRF